MKAGLTPCHEGHITFPYHEGQITIPYHEGQVTIPYHEGQVTIPYHEGQVTIPYHEGQVTIPYHEGQVTIPYHEGQVTIPYHEGQVTIPYHEGQDVTKRLPRKLRNYAHNAYLVENSKGNLVLVRRCFWGEDMIAAKEEEPSLTVDFKVYRLYCSSSGKELRKERIRTLNGETIFLGDNNSISVPTSKYPQLQPNSIYYTHYYYAVYIRSYQFGSCDTGIFNFENGKFDKYYVPNFSTKGMPPIFVVPH
ncbi:hypothetical protein Lal_00009306 [Lupinus albus]|nr:hypothetical protein Lal_00009306 [Lupinus albus]